MSDTNERSVASAGSVAGEPVAWIVTDPSGRIEACRESFSEAAQLATDFTATEDGDVVYKAFPVYSQPQNGVVVQLPRLLWDSSEKMGKGEWDYQQRVKTALEVAGVKWAVVE